MMRDEQSPEPETDHPSNIVEAVHLQHHVPIGSVRIVRNSFLLESYSIHVMVNSRWVVIPVSLANSVLRI